MKQLKPRRSNFDIVNQYLGDGGALPLDILLDNARLYYAQGQALRAAAKRAAERGAPEVARLLSAADIALARAESAAEKAAPFLHPRLQTFSIENKDGRPFIIQIADGLEDLA